MSESSVEEKVQVRPFHAGDEPMLDGIRMAYTDATLDVPHGYAGGNIETAIAEVNGAFVASLTGTLVQVLDPLITNKDASRLDIMRALVKLEAILTYSARKAGVTDAYALVPESMPDYIRILEKSGFQRLGRGHVLLRRPLMPDTKISIHELRERAVALGQSIEENVFAEVAHDAVE